MQMQLNLEGLAQAGNGQVTLAFAVEIARIVQNPNLTGQLSDSARHEIEVFNPQNATLKQTIAVMELLKQDMANRKNSLDTQLKDTRSRIGSGAETGPKVGDIKTFPNGNKGRWDGKGWELVK